jgi:hypothetical protein
MTIALPAARGVGGGLGKRWEECKECGTDLPAAQKPAKHLAIIVQIPCGEYRCPCLQAMGRIQILQSVVSTLQRACCRAAHPTPALRNTVFVMHLVSCLSAYPDSAHRHASFKRSQRCSLHHTWVGGCGGRMYG